MKRFWAIFKARNLEFFRDRGTFIWNIVLPLLLIFGFYFAFSTDNTTVYKIGVLGTPDSQMDFVNYKYLQMIDYPDKEEALDKLAHHQIDLVLDFDNQGYYVNEESSSSYLTEKILLSAPSDKLARNVVTGQKIRYIDWFVPGVIGLNILMGCLVGVGFVIVRYRKNGVLKRFKATPLKAIEFITAQMFSRFFIMIFMICVIFIGSSFFLHFVVRGSYFDLFLVTALSILCLISLGLLFATRIKSEELAGGVLNILLWPMMFLSGIFFSLEGTPEIMQKASQIFPVTHFIAASRAIMLDGASLLGVMDHILVLGAMTIGFLLISSFIFKWE